MGAGAAGRRRVGWRIIRAVLVVVGWIVIVAAVDAGIGGVLGGTGGPGPPPDALLAGPTGELEPSTDRDPRIDSPAMADAEWAEAYFAEFAALQYEYVPYIGSRMVETDGRYINGADGQRRSYQQPDAPSDAPVVWFFGGSTMWGEGQRDQHTIPSEVARLAGADGIDLRVANRAERGFVLWQEMLTSDT